MESSNCSTVSTPTIVIDSEANSAPKIDVQRATPNDSAEIWQWRNDEHTRAMFLNQKEVSWEQHCKWYELALIDPKTLLYVGFLGTIEKIGMCRFDLSSEKDIAYVSININPTDRKRGMSQILLATSIDFFRKENKVDLLAIIKKRNTPSIKCFERCGFILRDEKDEYSTYIRHQ